MVSLSAFHDPNPSDIRCALFGALAAFSVMKVKFSANLYEMLSADLPEVQGMDQLSRFFNRDGQLAITARANESWVTDDALVSLVAMLEEHPEHFGEVHRELGPSELVTEGGGLIAWIGGDGQSSGN